MSLSNPNTNFKLKVLLTSKTREHILQIIKDYNDYCEANDLKDNMLKGYSKKPYNTKEGLIDFLLEHLSEEEMEGILKKIEQSYLEELFNEAQAYIKKENAREKLDSLNFSDNELKLEFKGWQWESKTSLTLSKDETLSSYDCSCKTGQMNGFCPHLFTGLLILIKQKKFNQTTFPFIIPETSLNQIAQLEVELSEFEALDKTSADIILGDDYFISVNGNLVTLKWGGERPGKTVKDVTEEGKGTSVALWVAKKVVDKILAPLKGSSSPREIYRDKFGVIPVILENEKLVTKLLNKFQETNERENTNLPSTKEDLENFLKSKI
jgi:hypothetical protein